MPRAIKIFLVEPKWTGGTLFFFKEALRALGIESKSFIIPEREFYRRRLVPTRLLEVEFAHKRLRRWYLRSINDELLRTATEYAPTIFFAQNESDILPETIEEIRSRGAITVNLNGDYAFDSARYQYLPISFKHYDVILYGEKMWLENYRRIAPRTRFYKTVGAYAEKYFFPVDASREQRLSEFAADCSFAGSAYGFKAEGHYRVEILNSVADLGLAIWGGDAWERYFGYFPRLRGCYRGRSLSFDELNLLYQASSINLNITNPQCLTTFQQRFFEVAAAGGFQIADWKEELFDYADENQLATFRTIDELRDKIGYYLSHESERVAMARALHERIVAGKHTYADRMNEYLRYILDDWTRTA